MTSTEENNKRKPEDAHEREAKITALFWVIVLIIGTTLLAVICFAPGGVKMIPIGLIIAAAIIGYYSTPMPEHWIIEFLGAYWGEWKPGPHFLIPGLMRVRSRVPMATTIIELYLDEENKLDFKDDSAPVNIRIKVRPFNAYKATYEIQISPAFIEKVKELKLQGWEYATEEQVDSAFRGVCGSIYIDDALETAVKKTVSHQEEFIPISERVKQIVEESLQRWGIKFEEALLTDVKLSDDTEKKRRKLHLAKMDVKIAGEEKEKKIIDQLAIGEGEFKKISTIADGLELTNEQVITYLLTGELYDALRASTFIATSSGGTLNVPEASAIFAGINKQITSRGNA